MKIDYEYLSKIRRAVALYTKRKTSNILDGDFRSIHRGRSLEFDDLKEYAERYYSDAAYEKLRMKYSHARPFTKESLLYREIFEKHYPGQAEMISDFWMPNKSWEGCNVDDPSARVLSNYGDSGK